jgi:hypothetical protein
MRGPLACYLAGLVLCALCFFTSYATQFALYNEPAGHVSRGRHMWWVRATVALALGSVAAFGIGSWWAVVAFGPR